MTSSPGDPLFASNPALSATGDDSILPDLSRGRRNEPLIDSRPDLVADLRTLAVSMDADRYPGSDIVRDAADLLALDMADE